ncbi:bud site selection protein 21 [[Candida] railenensis]|uniref:Bud site selection protein 21 n=1 Tax=[Candida] railenensis TaxID=45579 RepID=A0A9P0QS49_9ASCO|nr:bud site selection protein 21 [[Candida] railenensis]
MVVTRSVKAKPSISVDAPKPKKIKFSDDSFNDTEFLTADEAGEKIKDDEVEGEGEYSDSDSDSDSDEAPEEESTSQAKELIIKRQKEQKELELVQKREEKERRRKQDLLHSEQQKLKKQEQETKAEDGELPDFLPEDIFDSIDQEEEQDDEDIEQSTKGKHLKLSDFEDMDKRELAKQIKEEKLRQLKLKKRLSIKKGPVHVNVTSAAARQINKKLVPVAESKVVNSRSKWLKRKSLGKK